MTSRARPYLIIVVAAIVAATIAWPKIRPESESTFGPTAETSAGVVGLIVEPDDGRAPVLAEIASARSTIDLMVYLLTDEPVINALIDAEGRGVKVRVVLDQYPFGGSGNPEETASRLRNSGIEVKWGLDRFTFTHVKTMIVDRSIALIMNLNLTRSAFESNREFAIVTTRPDDVMTAHAIFEADWRDDDDPELGTLVVSPLNSRSELLELLDSAVGTVDIYAEVVRDDEFVARLISLEEEGIQVRIMTSPDPDPVGTGILDELGRSGVEIRLVGTPYIHAKAIVVDDRAAYVGSQNFTETSLDENREVGLILDDVVVTHRIASTFARDFVSADPLIAQS